MDTTDLDLEESGPFRARSRTWPLPRPDTCNQEKEMSDDCANTNGLLHDPIIPLTAKDATLDMINRDGPKKNSSRRNAWGNMSYAELITQAISSSSEQRLTLAQIYDWMVQNVQHFRDKGDSNSSAGWKVCSNYILI